MRALGASRTSVVPGGALAGGWTRNALWKTARAVPSLDLRFADNKSLGDAVGGGSLVTFTRASSGTFVGSDGLIHTAATDVPRFDHNPTTGESLGLLLEEARTNLLLNSATLSTQSVTVAAAANTLSFYGTGTVTLTGVSTAGPLVGTGANNRVSLTFTPTVGVLVLTVSGSVTNAQLEAGAFPSSYIPTTSATVTRAADVASITGSNFSFYNQTEGTVFSDCVSTFSSTQVLVNIAATAANTATSAISLASNLTSSQKRVRVRDAASADQASLGLGGSSSGSRTRIAAAIKANDFAASLDGGAALTDTTGTVPTVVLMEIGSAPSGVTLGTQLHRRITYWPVRLPNTSLQAITQP